MIETDSIFRGDTVFDFVGLGDLTFVDLGFASFAVFIAVLFFTDTEITDEVVVEDLGFIVIEVPNSGAECHN